MPAIREAAVWGWLKGVRSPNPSSRNIIAGIFVHTDRKI